jgi:hypothetical protein
VFSFVLLLRWRECSGDITLCFLHSARAKSHDQCAPSRPADSTIAFGGGKTADLPLEATEGFAVLAKDSGKIGWKLDDERAHLHCMRTYTHVPPSPLTLTFHLIRIDLGGPGTYTLPPVSVMGVARGAYAHTFGVPSRLLSYSGGFTLFVALSVTHAHTQHAHTFGVPSSLLAHSGGLSRFKCLLRSLRSMCYTSYAHTFGVPSRLSLDSGGFTCLLYSLYALSVTHTHTHSVCLRETFVGYT